MSTNSEFDIPTNATKLALLICDTPVPAVLERDGTYHDVYHTWLRITHPKNDIPSESTFILEGFDVKEQIYPDLDSNNYSGILISGSGSVIYTTSSCSSYLIHESKSRRLCVWRILKLLPSPSPPPHFSSSLKYPRVQSCFCI